MDENTNDPTPCTTTTGPRRRASSSPVHHALNLSVARVLHELADLLAAQHADSRRVASFRHAAATVEQMPTRLTEVCEGGGLEQLGRALGRTIVATIAEIVSTGRCRELDRLRGSLGPEQVFQTLPGVGATLAQRLHESLQVETLEELEMAAHDGRLEAVSGVGPRRAAALRAALTEVLSRVRDRRVEDPEHLAPEPGVALLLDVDREYRERARAGTLPKIAPRRFNPTGTAWLPILHSRQGPWHMTALFSNTARAHELGKTRDWVIVYSSDGDHREQQHTVVTETRGLLAGRRVVRGHEADCLALYRPDTEQLASVENG